MRSFSGFVPVLAGALLLVASCKKDDDVTCQNLTPIVERVSAFAPVTQCLFDNRVLLVDATTAQAVTYIWSHDETNPAALINQPGAYAVWALDSAGDTVTQASFEIKQCPQSLFIPNSFSPNDDGINDKWSPQGLSLCTIQITIRDLEGRPVFESEGPNTGWDGKKSDGKENAPAGAYLYQAKVVFINGDEKVESGAVELIR